MERLIDSLGRAALERVRLSRDARFDGKIFIAVRTTRIYCRPICPSPSSKPRNVRYYETAAEAEQAGFRPCLRCRPEVAPGTPAWRGTSATVRRALRLIGQGALDSGSVTDLADRLGVGTRHLVRLFEEHVGATPTAIAQTRRVQAAKRLLDETSLPITDVALAAGYGSIRRFNHCFRQVYRCTPRELRRQRGAGRTPAAADEVTLHLPFRAPYDWEYVLEHLQRFAIPGVEAVLEGTYLRNLRCGERMAQIRIACDRRRSQIELSVRGAGASDILDIATSARRVLDLSADPMQLASAFRRDPLAGPLLRRWPGIRLVGCWDPFEAAVRALLGETLQRPVDPSVRAQLIGDEARTPQPAGSVLTHCFPRAADALQHRNASIRNLAQADIAGALDWHADPQDLLTQLSALPGFSHAAAQYTLLRGLHEPDAFPVEPGEAPERPHTRTPSERWRPWRGYALALLARAEESTAIGAHPADHRAA